MIKGMRSRRGQSAVEYLVTHGWALIVLVLVVTILYGLGIFNPNRFVAEECVFQPGFSCASTPRLHLYGGSTTISGNKVKYVMGTNLTNGLGYDIVITGYTVTSTDFITTDTFSCSNIQGVSSCSQGMVFPSPPPNTRALLINGETQIFNLALAIPSSGPGGEANLKVGDVRELHITFYYKNCNAGVWKRGDVAPYSLSEFDRGVRLGSCTVNPASEHVISGKIVARVGREINTFTVYT